MVSTYDFLVVGAGSSGSVVAARLADTGAEVGAVLSPQYPEERTPKVLNRNECHQIQNHPR